jgi:hypothetical protein
VIFGKIILGRTGGAPSWRAQLDRLVRELQALDGNVIAVGLEIAGGNFCRPGVVQGPHHVRRSGLVEQIDHHRPALDGVHLERVIPSPKFGIADEDAFAHGDVAGSSVARHLDRVEIRVVAVPVIDPQALAVRAAQLLKFCRGAVAEPDRDAEFRRRRGVVLLVFFVVGHVRVPLSRQERCAFYILP